MLIIDIYGGATPARSEREQAGDVLVLPLLRHEPREGQTGTTLRPPDPRSSISALSRQRRRHVYCAGMDVVLKTTASPRRSF